MKDKKAKSPLLALPAEIRNVIWSLLLIHDCDLYYLQTIDGPDSSSGIVDDDDRPLARFCPNVLQTCRQINQEATPMLYGGNVFTAHSSLLASLPRLILCWRGTLRLLCAPVTHPRAVALVRRFRLSLRLDTDPQFTREQAREAFSGADELCVDVSQTMFSGCDLQALRLLEGVRAVKLASVIGSVGDGKYAKWLERLMMGSADAIGSPDGKDLTGEDWNAWDHGNR